MLQVPTIAVFSVYSLVRIIARVCFIGAESGVTYRSELASPSVALVRQSSRTSTSMELAFVALAFVFVYIARYRELCVNPSIVTPNPI